jgi:predicted transcriptional regulator
MGKNVNNELFSVKTVAEWIEGARRRPVPKALFGEFWLEGEVAIMFADTGKGKSILAVQIAEALATGKSIEPFETRVPPQKVLYLDFELTDKQFEMRYAEDGETSEEGLRNHYDFSENFYRAEVVAMDEHPGPVYKTFDEYLAAKLNDLLRKTEAKILIVDNLTYLKRSNELTGEAVRLMKALKDMRTSYGLSILVLAHTPKRAVRSPLNVNDLQGSKVLSNFADNIFAIGGSTTDSDVRYLKHIKLRSTEMEYDSLNVPTFRLGKRGGNFLAFQFQKFDDERNLLDGRLGAYDRELMEKIRLAAADGMTQRAIAAFLNVSKTTVNRYMRLRQAEDREAKERVGPISRRAIERARQELIYEAARRRMEELRAERLAEEEREVERGRRLSDRSERQLAPGLMQLPVIGVRPAADDQENAVSTASTAAVDGALEDFDDDCDCQECVAGNPDKCLVTDWSEQCCDGTDPNCCGGPEPA